MKTKTELLADIDRITAERDAMQQRLTAADERDDQRKELLRNLDEAWNSHDGRELFGKLMLKVEAALKPAEGGGDERPAGCCCPPKGHKGIWAAAMCPIHHGLKARTSLHPENQRITPAPFKCLACGEYHEGSGNLPCPNMSPYSRIEQ